MIQYTIRRLLLAIPVLFAILLVVFAIARSIPGDPCKSILGEKATQTMCDDFAERFGLDEPIPVQFGIYMSDILKGDLGNSIRFNRPITVMLAERLPMTIELGIAAMSIAIFVGIPAGVISAIKRNSAADVVTMTIATIGVSIPVFFLALMLIYFFAVFLRDTPFALPPSGRLSAGLKPIPFYEVWELDVSEESNFYLFYVFIAKHYIFNSLITANWEVLFDAGKHLILPAVALSTIPMAILARITRSSMLEVLGLDYIRTAKAKGLTRGIIVGKHALRNAMLPVITVAGLQLAGILGGAVLTETIFSLPGVGLSVFEAITARDFPVIQGFVIVIAVIYLILNLLVDLSYAVLDPRIRLD